MFNRSSVVKAFALAALLVMSAGAASAQDESAVKWTYIEAGYLSVDVDTPLADSGDNWFAGGSFGLGKSWHIIGQYADGDLSDTLEREDMRIGLGWHGLLGSKADLVGEAYWIDTEFTDVSPSPGPSVSDDGYRAVAGIRWQLLPILELDGFVNYSDYSDGGDSTSVELRAIVNIWRIGLGAGYEMAEVNPSGVSGADADADQYNVFVRFSFK